ncbi:type 1 glutamine amidotransferase [Sporolactobacillus sp. CPB3-1]|uniref:Type 1 glutamine amidotransferase n=1 Tax=Sporolactobacillus mangiferae TaxID=2940498 RepID=A0ABT0M802_9BACL|nr:type 1 glutamine amidotransferase [Sporolactobacillus mangiferae]MCL1630718.1 type 1 glutamine amidotransferase [Sporolactobacillus mangiferae]
MHLHYFQHVSFETPGFVANWCEKRGHKFTGTLFFEEKPDVPDLSDIDLLVVMGGPMNIDEETVYPWLRQEKQWICEAVERRIPVLGICLGAQLLASALGARVFPGKEKEIGWYPITWMNQSEPIFLKMPEKMTVFHWHGDTFDLPDGASHMAFSKACSNQAFVYHQKFVGLQFHLEVDEKNIRKMIEHGRDELMLGGRFVQGISELSGQRAIVQRNKKVFFDFLDRWAGRIAGH